MVAKQQLGMVPLSAMVAKQGPSPRSAMVVTAPATALATAIENGGETTGAGAAGAPAAGAKADQCDGETTEHDAIMPEHDAIMPKHDAITLMHQFCQFQCLQHHWRDWQR